jgi:hypothetical protein
MHKATILLLPLALLLSGCSTSQLYGASVGLTAADWGQTRTIAQNPGIWYERNPVLGRHPSTERVNLYFAGWMLINALIYSEAPESLAKPYFWLYNAVEVAAVGNNLHLGIGVDF